MKQYLEVGDHVNHGINGDAYPAIVVATTPSKKTVWVKDVPYTIVAREEHGRWVPINASSPHDIDDFDNVSTVDFGMTVRIKYHPEKVDMDTKEYKGRRYFYSKARGRYDTNGGGDILYPGLRYTRNPHI